MKSITTKLNLTLMMVCFFTISFAIFQKSYAAFPAKKKQEQNTSVQSQISNSENQTLKFEDANSQKDDDNTVLLIVLCFLLPPLAVYLYFNEWNKTCTINLILTLLCGLPGVIHALYVILSKK